MAEEKSTIDFGSLLSKVGQYQRILNNTIEYRKAWPLEIKPMIQSVLNEFIKHMDLKAEVRVQDKIENLESVMLDLGRSHSGISESMDDTDIKRTMIKSNGALVYQQLFNGKIMVMVLNPSIEGYGEPKAPITLEILRPEEVRQGFILRHLEIFMKNITEWEDYDDDLPTKTPIGFQPITLRPETPLE